MKARLLFPVLLFPLFVCAQLNTERVMLIGRNALYYDDYVLSIQYFNQVIGAKPYLYEPYYYRGLAKFYLEDYGGAVQDCSSAIERNPFIRDVYRLRGLCNIKTGNYLQSVEDYTQALHLEPEDQMSWYNRMLCRIQMKDYPNAFADLDTMIMKWPEYVKAYEVKSQLLLETKDTLRADSVMDVVLKRNPQNGPVWGMKGLVALRRGVYQHADSFLTKAIKYQPQETTYYLNRALANYYMRRLRNAMGDYDQALFLDPDNFFGHYNRGLLRAQVGEDNKAIEDFSFVIQREPNNLLAVFNRALLYEQTGNYRGAIADYSRVIRKHPRFWTGMENRARCYRRIGNVSAALRDERKLTIAQLDQMFGTSPRRNKSATRGRKEQDIEDYKKLVVDDSEDTTSYRKYESEFRGKVQNRKVSDHLRPVFGFSVQGKTISGLAETYYYFPLLEEWCRKSLPSHFRLKLQCREQGETADAYQELFQAIATAERKSKETSSDSSSLVLGVLYAVARDYSSALVQLNQATSQESPYKALAYWQRAVVKLGLQESETPTSRTAQTTPLAVTAGLSAVLTDFEQAQRLLPQNAFLLYNRANVYYEMAQYSTAAELYTQALKIDSRLADAYYNRGLTYMRMNKVQEGLADLSKAGELGLYSAYSLIKQYRTQSSSAKEKH